MTLRLAPAWLAAVLALAPLAASADSAKLWSFKPEKGFVDDAMAFSADGSRFAYLHTDASEFLTVVVLKTDGFKKETELKVEDASRVPKQLAFTPDGSRLTLIWTDGHSGAASAAVYEVASGKVLKKLGPAASAAVADCNGEQCITLTTQKSGAAGATVYTVTATRTRDLKPAGSGSVTVNADQTLKTPAIRVLYWEPGNLTLLGMAKGKYDKKRDVRLPERAVRWGVLARKEVWGEEPKDVLEWAKATSMRPNHLGQLRFVQVSDDLKKLHAVDAANVLTTVATPIRWDLYEPKSLVQAESWDAKTLWFSLTIDPVNKEAVKRKKADKERVDLYRLDGGKATLLGQVETGKRGFGWAASGSHFSYLRRLKGFGRGGTQIELYKISK